MLTHTYSKQTSEKQISHKSKIFKISSYIIYNKNLIIKAQER